MQSEPPTMPLPGEVIAGKYRIDGVLGEGGMGVVFEARHQRLDERFAIKILNPNMLEHPGIRDRFEREARAAVRLRGRNVARVTDVDVLPNGLPFMVMEYLEGQDLGDELTERGALPIGEAVNYVLQTCSAMDEAHQRGIVHRDLKPDNLFLTETANGRCVKVLDFGISKMTLEGDQSVTLTQTTLGTPLYMSPEQVRSAKNVDARTDVWSLGVILYELLTNTIPFAGESATAVAAAITADVPPPIETIRPEVAPGLAAVIRYALTKNLDDRCPSVEALANALLPFADDPSCWSPFRERPSSRSQGGGPAPRAASSDQLAVAPTVSAASLRTQPEWTRSEASGPQAATRPRRVLAFMAIGVGLVVAAALVVVTRPGAGDASADGSSGSEAASAEPPHAGQAESTPPVVSAPPSASLSAESANGVASGGAPSAASGGAAPTAAHSGRSAPPVRPPSPAPPKPTAPATKPKPPTERLPLTI